MNLIRTKPVIAIDPGTTHSGVVLFDGKEVIYSNKEYENEALVQHLLFEELVDEMAIEMEQ